ncbi:hypothetical protein [Mycobacterium leprae]|uniref:IpiB n=1 Tax=Mycobacterium leprae TaxID=1769 RepID=Q49641_MYCLR|nr:hypothetical protein [Mycobacterium leprae]AAA17090.1 ipiB [Mycobacterium leprae]
MIRWSNFINRFVQALNVTATRYVSARSVNASLLQTLEQELLGLVNASTETLLGHPLIGNGGMKGNGGQLAGTSGMMGAVQPFRVWT